MLMLRNRSLVSDPVFSRMDGLWKDFDRLFTNVFATDWLSTGAWVPPVEVEETGEHIRYVLEVPGIRPEDISVTVERNILTVSGEKKEERSAENATCHLTERRYGRFTRRFQLPARVDADAVAARHENGLLTITLPKVPAARPRQIRIETGEAPQLAETSDSAS
ncbi:MAG TPA: Hsp20/alpha crystallin family protein [Longimicrobiales bacterium]